MTREEMLYKAQKEAEKWYQKYEPILLAKQNIERNAVTSNEN